MINSGSGHVINMGSMAGLSARDYPIFAACKHDVHGFSEACGARSRPWGFHVSMIYPAAWRRVRQHAWHRAKESHDPPKALRSRGPGGRGVVK